MIKALPPWRFPHALLLSLFLTACGGGSDDTTATVPTDEPPPSQEDPGSPPQTQDPEPIPELTALSAVSPAANGSLSIQSNNRYSFIFNADSDGGVAEYRVSVLNDNTGTGTGYTAVTARGVDNPSPYTVERELALQVGVPYRWAVFAHDSNGQQLLRSDYAAFTLSGTPPSEDPSTVDAEYSASARFLSRATFGTQPQSSAALERSTPSQWFLNQLTTTPSTYLEPALSALRSGWYINSEMDRVYNQESNAFPFHRFWQNAVGGSDQLRQRMAFALSQILVISASDGGVLAKDPNAVAHYQQILSDNAFGNYRDLLDAVTWSPAMGTYLTYLCNERGDPATGRVPDENYAREIMQLFTIGLVELNPNGTVRTDARGNPIPTYDNADVTGLARVFTGLSPRASSFCGHERIAGVGVGDYALNQPMQLFSAYHSTLPKSFLGLTIPANTDGRTSISRALDHLFAHANVAPFIGRQLIQRFVTSDPAPAYIARVSAAFESGNFRLPTGQNVGTGRRGDLAATLAAVLFDAVANAAPDASNTTGKLREPVLRLTQWMRAFAAGSTHPQWTPALWSTHASNTLAQAPYKAPSVFNFFRPGYVLPQSETGARGMTTPEMQLLNASSIPGYANFLYAFISHNLDPTDPEDLGDQTLSSIQRAQRFQPDYSTELSLAEDAEQLVDSLTNTLNYGRLSSGTRARIVNAVDGLPADRTRARVEVAILMLMTSPDYLVLR